MPIALPYKLPRIIGHRGAAGLAPENTLAGFGVARRAGVAWVEFDVRLTADGRCILLHDDTLERTTDAGEVEASELTLAELAAFDAGGWFGPDFAGEPVPTLEEAVDTLSALGLGANVEIKPAPGQEVETARAVAEVLRASWPENLPAPLLSSFEFPALEAALEAIPELPRGLLLEAVPADWRALAERLQVATINCDHATLTAERAAEIKAAGYPLLCYTVNHAGRATELFGWGVDGVFTDFPDRLASV